MSVPTYDTPVHPFTKPQLASASEITHKECGWPPGMRYNSL